MFVIQVRIRRAPVPIHTWMFTCVQHLTDGGGCPALKGRTLAVAICRGPRSSAGRSGQAGGDAPGRLFHPWAAGRRLLKGLGCDFSVGWVLEIPSCAWPGSVLLGRVSLPFCCRWAHGTWARAVLLWAVKSLVLMLWLFRTRVLPVKLMPLFAARSCAGPSDHPWGREQAMGDVEVVSSWGCGRTERWSAAVMSLPAFPVVQPCIASPVGCSCDTGTLGAKPAVTCCPCSWVSSYLLLLSQGSFQVLPIGLIQTQVSQAKTSLP